jgi:hypothetical protein
MMGGLDAHQIDSQFFDVGLFFRTWNSWSGLSTCVFTNFGTEIIEGLKRLMMTGRLFSCCFFGCGF